MDVGVGTEEAGGPGVVEAGVHVQQVELRQVLMTAVAVLTAGEIAVGRLSGYWSYVFAVIASHVPVS